MATQAKQTRDFQAKFIALLVERLAERNAEVVINGGLNEWSGTGFVQPRSSLQNLVWFEYSFLGPRAEFRIHTPGEGLIADLRFEYEDGQRAENVLDLILAPVPEPEEVPA